MNKATRIVLVLLLLGAAIIVGGRANADPVPKPPTKSKTFKNLKKIKVRKELSRRGYRHDKWGKGPDGCSIWSYIVRRDAIWYKLKPGSRCTVIDGKWRDPYSGRYLYNTKSIAVEHIVPLAEAYESGMKNFSKAKRYRLANDVRELLVSSDRMNRAKGGKSVRNWLPPLKSYRCKYIKYYIDIKKKYGLAMEAAEKSAAYRGLKANKCR